MSRVHNEILRIMALSILRDISSLKSIKVIEQCLEIVHEITKLVKKSPNRDAIFKHIKDEISGDAVTGTRLLCPTRWTVRAEAFSSISENCRALVLCWDAAREATKDSEARARIMGVAAQMEKFECFFALGLGRKILNMIDNLSRSCKPSTCLPVKAKNWYK